VELYDASGASVEQASGLYDSASGRIAGSEERRAGRQPKQAGGLFHPQKIQSNPTKSTRFKHFFAKPFRIKLMIMITMRTRQYKGQPNPSATLETCELRIKNSKLKTDYRPGRVLPCHFWPQLKCFTNKNLRFTKGHYKNSR